MNVLPIYSHYYCRLINKGYHNYIKLYLIIRYKHTNYMANFYFVLQYTNYYEIMPNGPSGLPMDPPPPIGGAVNA